MHPTDPNESIQLIPASRFSLDELTAIYNQTRVDYMIPMPMNAARLAEYVRIYDVDLNHSLVATTHTGQMLGVAMLGVRKNRVWLTRLGVLPNTRRGGIGSALVGGLIEDAAKLGLDFVMLEVIKNNTPAHQLFLKYGFREIGELLVLRRSPLIPPIDPIVADAQRMDRTEAQIGRAHV